MTPFLLHLLNREFERISRRFADYPVYRAITVFLPLLLLPFLAPACAPNEPLPARVPSKNIVLLTDTSLWKTGKLTAYKDSLSATGYRVLVSGYPGESAAGLTARLPWLLQPGVDLFIYDNKLAGEAGKDSLINYLKANDHPARIQTIDQ